MSSPNKLQLYDFGNPLIDDTTEGDFVAYAEGKRSRGKRSIKAKPIANQETLRHRVTSSTALANSAEQAQHSADFKEVAPSATGSTPTHIDSAQQAPVADSEEVAPGSTTGLTRSDQNLAAELPGQPPAPAGTTRDSIDATTRQRARAALLEDEASLEQVKENATRELDLVRAKAEIVAQRQYTEALARKKVTKMEEEDERKEEEALWETYLEAHPAKRRFHERRAGWTKLIDEVVIIFWYTEIFINLFVTVWLPASVFLPTLNTPVVNIIVALLCTSSFAEWAVMLLHAGSDALTSKAPFIRAFQRRCRPYWTRSFIRFLIASAAFYKAVPGVRGGVKELSDGVNDIVKAGVAAWHRRVGGA